MKTITYRNHGLRITDVWFADDNWKSVKTDILRIHGIENLSGIPEEYVTVQHTLVTDLRQSEEDLRNSIASKNFKYEIRRSEKDGVEIKFYSSADLKNQITILQDFKQCYDKMFEDKGKEVSLNLNALYKYVLDNALSMSVAYYNDRPIVFHSYVWSEEIVRFFHSCSLFREEKELAQLIGRANKRLHWEDWLHFKKLGVSYYDWGGVFAFDSDDGIDKFKRCFGGRPTVYYNVEMPISRIGKIVNVFLQRTKQ